MKTVLLLLATVAASLVSASAQDWKAIEPLVSTCDDIKRILEIQNCKLPTTRIKGQVYNLTIDFADENSEWDVPKGTVVRVFVLFHDLPKLSAYVQDIKDYKIEREYDVENIVKYDNPKKGIKLETQTGAAPEPYISSIVIYPSEENAKKFTCKK